MADSSNPRLNASDLNEIEDWCEDVLNGYREGKSLGARLCAYTDDLPTHSIRSTVASLVAEVRRLRAVERPAVERLAAALREIVEMDQPPHGFPDSECPICDARDKARNLLAEFGQQPTGDEQ